MSTFRRFWMLVGAGVMLSFFSSMAMAATLAGSSSFAVNLFLLEGDSPLPIAVTLTAGSAPGSLELSGDGNVATGTLDNLTAKFVVTETLADGTVSTANLSITFSDVEYTKFEGRMTQTVDVNGTATTTTVDWIGAKTDGNLHWVSP